MGCDVVDASLPPGCIWYVWKDFPVPEINTPPLCADLHAPSRRIFGDVVGRVLGARKQAQCVPQAVVLSRRTVRLAAFRQHGRLSYRLRPLLSSTDPSREAITPSSSLALHRSFSLQLTPPRLHVCTAARPLAPPQITYQSYTAEECHDAGLQPTPSPSQTPSRDYSSPSTTTVSRPLNEVTPSTTDATT